MKLTKPYNSYNIFFILERKLLLETRQSGAAAASPAKTARPRPSSPDAGAPVASLTGYEYVEVPPLPLRYQHLQSSMEANWYDPGRKKNVKRRHGKSHGVASFREIAKTTADNWKVIDPVTKTFVEAVALILKRRYKELQDIGGLGCFGVGSSPTPVVAKADSSADALRIKNHRQEKANNERSEQTNSQQPRRVSMESVTQEITTMASSTVYTATRADLDSSLSKFVSCDNNVVNCPSSENIKNDRDLIWNPITISPINPRVSNMVGPSRSAPGTLVKDRVNSNTIRDIDMTRASLYQEADVSDLDILSYYFSI